MRILFVEDNAADADLTLRVLTREGSDNQVVVAGTIAEGRAALEGDGARQFDVMLCDLNLPDGSGMELVHLARDEDLALAVVVLSGSGNERSAVAALKAGASDYLVKSGDYLEVLPAVLESALAAVRAGAARRARPLRVLYAEHHAHDIDITRRHLARHAPHIRLETVHTGEAALARLAGPGTAVDVLLLDYRLTGLTALEVLERLAGRTGQVLPTLIVTGQGSESIAVQALRRGAVDYLVKRPGYLHELPSALENAHNREMLAREQQALRASDERFRQITENIEEVYWVKDLPSGLYSYISPAFEKIWGRPVSYLLGKPSKVWLETVMPEDQAAIGAMLTTPPTDHGMESEYRVLRPSGEMRWIRSRSSPVRDARGEVYRMVGVCEDITERKQLETQLRQGQKMEAIGRLAGGVAHDFNNLLTVIMGRIGLLRIQPNITPKIEESLREMELASERAARLTRQLLAFGRKQTLTMAVVNLNEVVAELSKLLRRLLRENIHMEVVVAPAPLWVRGDAGLLGQVLMNLVVNARDAMPHGGELIITTFRESGGGNGAEQRVGFRVEDTGTGIAEDVLPHIFEPFFTTKPMEQGSGLGLATAFGIMEQHHGVITAQNRPGGGASFVVLLAPERGPDGVFLTEEPAKTTAAASQGETILMVEDEEAVREIVEMALQTSGYTVLGAARGKEALAVWAREKGRIDLVLTDIVMPEGVSGFDLARRIAAEAPELPILFTSGYNAHGDVGEITLVEGENYLTKPYELETLRLIVRRALDRARAPR